MATFLTRFNLKSAHRVLHCLPPIATAAAPETQLEASRLDGAWEIQQAPRAPVTIWQMVMYVVDRTERTVRLCVIILVAAVAAFLIPK
jgi:hypothetical protein